jgi:hypothetical protein
MKIQGLTLIAVSAGRFQEEKIIRGSIQFEVPNKTLYRGGQGSYLESLHESV